MCLMLGCTQTQVHDTPINQQSFRAPSYRLVPTLRIVIEPPQVFTIVKGYEDRVQGFLNQASKHLLTTYGFQLKGTYGKDDTNSLTIVLSADPHAEAKQSHYGTMSIPVQLTLADLARGKSVNVARQISHGVLTQLGVPQSCLNTAISKPDTIQLRRMTEAHLERTGETVQFRRVTRSVIAQELLTITSLPKRETSCLNSVSAEGHRQLWRDLAGEIDPTTNEPTLVPSFLEKGRRALRRNDPRTAYKLCSEHAERTPQSGAARCAATAAQVQELYPEAIRMWRAHLSFHPQDRPAILALARCVGRSGDDDGARAVLALATRDHPNWADVRVELGIALYRLSQVAAARSQWEQAIKLDPKNKDAARLLSGFR